MSTYDHLYLSPHLDDVILSCGGTIWQQVRAGERVLVLTVFAGSPSPDAPLSPFAQELHARWETLTDASALRREEDLAALAVLGAETMHWPYTDCVYRRTPAGCFPYTSGETLFGPVHPAEKGLIAELATRLAALLQRQGGAAIYVPLGIGHHVDHQIVRQAAEASGHALAYYEDFPYAQDRQAMQQVSMPGQARVHLELLSEQALEAKLAAIACYRSQVSTFWDDAAHIASSVRAFAEQTGGGRLAERYWRLEL